MKFRQLFLLVLALGLPAGFSARAQWLTQLVPLKAGWNAVFLHVDASYATLDQLVGGAAPKPTPIVEVWRWNPDPADAAGVEAPQLPSGPSSQWTSWKRAENNTSVLQSVAGNTAYLVYSSSDYTWRLKGRPVLPRYAWSTAGLNLLGFPTTSPTPPNFEAYFSVAPTLPGAEFYQYPGGDLGTNNPSRVFALRTTPVTRGKAYWVRAGENFNRYFSPFEITSGQTGGFDFGSDESVLAFRVRNVTDRPLTVALRLKPSEAVPAGQRPIVALPPLLWRGPQNLADLTYASTNFTTNFVVNTTLAAAGQPGSETEYVIGLDRLRLSDTVGDYYAGLLQFTDSLGYAQIDVGISGTVGSTAGLWVGTAKVGEVAQYLTRYERGADDAPTVGTNGSYRVAGLVTNLASTPTSFPLRLLVHAPTNGPARLFQQIFYGFDDASNAVVTTRETVLSSNRRADARRLSAAHLPWTADNPGWPFDGPLTRGATLRTSVTNAYDNQASNPFLHTFHPDHDNLDVRFGQALAQGAESYTVVRDVVLSVTAPDNDFASRVSAATTLTGTYSETLRFLGLARAGNAFDTRSFAVRGTFQLNRLTDVPRLTRAR